MTRQNKLIILLIYVLILTAALFAFRANRGAKVKKLRMEIDSVEAEMNRQRTAENELKKMSRLIPAEAGITGFMEELYRCARESGIKQHDVATETNAMGATARPGGAVVSGVIRERLKVSLSGGYRSIAEYIRRVQNIERFNRILEMKLSSDADQVKGDMVIELYSLPVKP